MSNAEFDTLAAKTRIRPRSLAGARRVLVDGLSCMKAAVEQGYSRETVIVRAVNQLRSLIEVRYCAHCGQTIN